MACSQEVVNSNPSALKALSGLALLSTPSTCGGGVLGWANKAAVTGFVLEIVFLQTHFSLSGENTPNESFPHSLAVVQGVEKLQVQVPSYHLKLCLSSNREAYRYITAKLKCKFLTAVLVGVHTINGAPD